MVNIVCNTAYIYSIVSETGNKTDKAARRWRRVA